MLDALKSLFRPPAPGAGSVDDNRRLRIAACALLLEIAHADDEFSAEERTQIEQVMERHFDLDRDTARELIEIADRERRDATDLHQFTSIVNQSYDEGQRMLIAELLWRVVDADGQLSKHEDALARKLAHLLELRPGYLNEARRRASGR